MALQNPNLGEFNYNRRQPEKTLIYKIISENVETFYRDTELEGRSIPQFVKDEFSAYLRCGILSYGFLRIQCESCSQAHLVAFSCKKRGFCPSCGASRMTEVSRHLSQELFHNKPLRQWVLTFPYNLRMMIVSVPGLQSQLIRIFHRILNRHYCKLGNLGVNEGKSGIVTFIQRFGAGLNLNPHLHSIAADGVYITGKRKGLFQFGRPPTTDKKERICRYISRPSLSEDRLNLIPYPLRNL